MTGRADHLHAVGGDDQLWEPNAEDFGDDDQLRTLVQDADDKIETQLDHSALVEKEYRRLRVQREAKGRLDADGLPTLRTLTFSQFLASKGAEPYVLGLFYRDSLSRVYGPPGGGKSLLLLDIGLRAALGWEWAGVPIHGGPVVFVMAEGQRVNHDRALAWLDHHSASDHDREQLEHRFITVPDAVMLTEHAARPFIDEVARIAPSLIILDTKNRMMIGEENSATDWGVLLRVLDELRTAAGGATVVLVDHTGHDADRPRGSTAGTGGVETEIRVREEKDTDGLIQAVVTRDKSAGDGFVRDFRIQVHDTPGLPPITSRQPVLVPSTTAPWTTVDLEELDATPSTRTDWRTAEDLSIPDRVRDYEGEGQQALPDLARFMAYEAAEARADPGGLGKSRAEAQAELTGHSKSSVHRAWSALKKLGVLEHASGSRGDTGRHRWSA